MADLADNGYWLKMAKEAFSASTSYIESNYTKKWEDAIKIFHSQHPSSSKYNSDAYRYRSRLFRPKSRSVVRKHEATAARAFFSNLDVTSISPQDGEDPKQIASAIINKELLQYRLQKTIPWFTTLIGAFQDAMKTGLVVSFQYWKFKSRDSEEEMEVTDAITLQKIRAKVPVTDIYEDEPCVELHPIENFRFSPNAQWNRVCETSPYLILKIKMYVYKVKEMASENAPESIRWNAVTDSELRGALDTGMDTTDATRRGGKESPGSQQTPPLNEYDTVSVHLNIMDSDEGHIVYYTLKDRKMLSNPVPLQEMFFHGKVPITVGFCVIDTHNPVPDGLIDLGKQLQTEANEIVNQRLDNVKLVLNKRWLVRRNSNVDTESLLRNVPGGVTMVSNTSADGGDIREVTWQDVTSSSYQEQDRVNVDYDDLTGGGINSGSVMTNRKLNETVGGMKMMAQGANDLTEYTIRTLVETWVEPVLKQLMLLEQYYESDEKILALAGKRAQLFQKFGQDRVTDSLLIQELTLTVNVGMGATDPQERLQRFTGALTFLTQVLPALPLDANLAEIEEELMGLIGYRDYTRFFSGKGDPRLIQAQQTIQQMQQEMQAMQQELKNNADELASKEKIAHANNVTNLLVAEHQGGGSPEAKLMEVSGKLQNESKKTDAHVAVQREKIHTMAGIQREKVKQDTFVKLAVGEMNADAKVQTAKLQPKQPAGAAQ